MPTVRGVSSAAATGNASASLSAPAGTQPGDVLIAFVRTNRFLDTHSNFSLSGGWSEVSLDPCTWKSTAGVGLVLAKIAGPSEPTYTASLTVNFTYTQS